MPDLELLPASYDLPGARLLDLVQVMDRIRRECPWSSGQTHEGLAKYAIEEAYELVEAIEDGDREELREELGDVLLQVVFHARIAEEDAEEPFSVDDVAGGIVAKLIHRHPHVFGEESASTPEEVKAHWLRTKAEEKRRDSVTEGVPLGQPGLALAAKLASRARTAGFDVPLPAGEGVGYELLALAARAEAEGWTPRPPCARRPAPTATRSAPGSRTQRSRTQRSRTHPSRTLRAEPGRRNADAERTARLRAPAPRQGARGRETGGPSPAVRVAVCMASPRRPRRPPPCSTGSSRRTRTPPTPGSAPTAPSTAPASPAVWRPGS